MSLKPGYGWQDLLGPGFKKAGIQVVQSFQEGTWILTHSHGVQLILTKAFIEDTSTDKLIDFITKWHASVQAALMLPIGKPATGDNLYPGKVFYADPVLNDLLGSQYKVAQDSWFEMTGEQLASPGVAQPLGFHVVDLDGMLVPEEFAQVVMKEESKLSSQSWWSSKYHLDDLYGSWPKQAAKTHKESIEAWSKKVDEAIVGKQYDHTIIDDLVVKNASVEKVTDSFKDLYDMIKSGQIKLPEPKKLDPLMKPPKSWFKF